MVRTARSRLKRHQHSRENAKRYREQRSPTARHLIQQKRTETSTMPPPTFGRSGEDPKARRSDLHIASVNESFDENSVDLGRVGATDQGRSKTRRIKRPPGSA